MKYLYVDRYRGFRNTYIPLTDVNFLVGENSTGKTSILNLLHIMARPTYWTDLIIDSYELNMRHFKDFSTPDKNGDGWFCIGMIREDTLSWKREEPKKQITASLVKFIDEGGMPVPSKCIFTYKNYAVSIRINETIGYKYPAFTEYSDIQKFIDDIYKKWVRCDIFDETGYQEITEGYETHDDGPVIDVDSAGTFQFFNLFKFIENEIDFSNGKKPEKRGMISYAIAFSPGKPVVWMGPIRAKPERTYDNYNFNFSPEGAHTPYQLKRALEAEDENAKRLQRFLEKIGNRSGLFETIKMKTYDAHEPTSPFEITVCINNRHYNIINVGYGVSQALPIFVELFLQKKKRIIAIQQPEVHLHSRAQAALGDVFHELASAEEKEFLVETHSDFIIDRYRMNMAAESKKEMKNPESQILFFERTNRENKVHPIPIFEDGSIPDEQPEAYREFFLKETLEFIKI